LTPVQELLGLVVRPFIDRSQQPGSLWSACLSNIDVLNVTLTFNIDISVENDVFNEALMLKRQSQGELMIPLNIIVYYGKNN